MKKITKFFIVGVFSISCFNIAFAGLNNTGANNSVNPKSDQLAQVQPNKVQASGEKQLAIDWPF